MKDMPRYEVILAIIGILIIGYLIVSQNGCFLVNRAETTEWTDGSSHDQLKRPENDKNPIVDARTEEVVQELAEIFAENPSGSDRGREAHATRYLSKDERAYYQEIREENAFDKQLDRAKDWYNVLKTAGQTYQMMESIFSRNQPEENPDDFYAQLEKQFNIPRSASESFAEQGTRALKDWALFAENYGKK